MNEVAFKRDLSREHLLQQPPATETQESRAIHTSKAATRGQQPKQQHALVGPTLVRKHCVEDVGWFFEKCAKATATAAAEATRHIAQQSCSLLLEGAEADPETCVFKLVDALSTDNGEKFKRFCLAHFTGKFSYRHCSLTHDLVRRERVIVPQ